MIQGNIEQLKYKMNSVEISHLIKTSNWISVKTMPPIAEKPRDGDPDLIYTHTDDVIVLCADGDVHRSYHDGDVWCYHNLSGCPQWDVTHWMPFSQG